MTTSALAHRAGPRVWAAWSGGRAAGLSRVLVLLGLASIFLQSAATVELVYTVRISYVLLLLACAVGLAYVVRGIRAVPALVRWLAAGLLAVYVVSAIFGVGDVVANGRGGSARTAVYLSDLAVGLAVAALIVGLSTVVPLVRPAVTALLAGAVVAAAYAVYEWTALEFDLPFRSVNNALNSDGLTRGEQTQGYGLGGTLRPRGTFLEPHFLAAYLATVVPLAYAIADPGWRRRLAVVAAALLLVALTLTSSAPAWFALAVGCMAAACAWTVATARPLGASALAAALMVLVLGCSLLLTDVAPLTRVTGRSEASLEQTVRFRTENWREALETWRTRPALGFGPGQSSVQLRPVLRRDPRPAARADVLGSAHGLWAAALVDSGVLGFGMWMLLLAVLIAAGWRLTMRCPTPVVVAILAAMTTGLVASQFSGDRLELRVWALIGLLGAALSGSAGSDASQRDQQCANRPA